MNKKELRKLIPEFQIEKDFDKETDYYIEEVKKTDVTCWGIYKKIQAFHYALLLIHFFDKEDWITYANNKWLKGKIDSLKDFDREYFYRCQHSMKDKYDKLTIWEEKRRYEQKQDYYNKKIAEFKEANKKVPQNIPNNFKKYIKNKVMPGYALYNNKEHEAKCTTCGKTFNISKLHRKDEIKCPHCKKNLTSIPSGRFNIQDERYACLIQKVAERKIVLRYFIAHHCYKNNRADKYGSYEVRRDFINLNDGSVEPYIWERFKASQTCTFIPQKYYKDSCSYYCEKDYWIGTSPIWTGNIYNIPELKYIFKNMQQENLNRIYKDATYNIAYIIRYPFLETWFKENRNIKIITDNINLITPKINEPAKAIGIPKNILKEIPDNSDSSIIPNIKYLIEEKIKINNQIVQYLAKNKLKIREDLESWKNNNGFKLQRVINYITKNNISFPDYRDYLNKVIQLDRELNRNLMCPGNFNQAHNEILLENKYKDERIKEEKYQEIKKTSKFKRIKLENLIIRQTESIREIVAEGLQQSNCVATYVDRILNNQTTVLFARKIDQPDVPYITIEIKNNTIAQARYSHNINCENRIYETISKYLKIINRKENIAA